MERRSAVMSLIVAVPTIRERMKHGLDGVRIVTGFLNRIVPRPEPGKDDRRAMQSSKMYRASCCRIDFSHFSEKENRNGNRGDSRFTRH